MLQVQAQKLVTLDSCVVIGIIKSLKTHDQSGWWRFSEDEIDPANSLRILRSVVETTDGRRTKITVREAEFGSKILRAIPGFRPWMAYVIARKYIARSNSEADDHDLDFFLASYDSFIDEPFELDRSPAKRKYLELHRKAWPDRAKERHDRAAVRGMKEAYEEHLQHLTELDEGN